MYPTKFTKPLLGWDWLQYAAPQKAWHPGLDLGLKGKDDYGQDIYATKPGFVEYIHDKPSWFHSRGFGNFVIIHHDDGKYTRHAHLSGFPGGLKVGQKVKGEDVVGFLGSTGSSNSPHDHFETFGEELAKIQRKHRVAGLKRPYCFYPRGKSKRWVMEHYDNPWEWLATVKNIPDWAIVAWKKAVGLGVAPDDPFEGIDIIKFQEILKELEVIGKVGTVPAYRAMVIADKLNLLG